MSTEQNYSAQPDRANPIEPAANFAAKTPSTPDNRQVNKVVRKHFGTTLAWSQLRTRRKAPDPMPFCSTYGAYIIDRLSKDGRLTKDQSIRAGIVRAQDDSMFPTIGEGVDFVAAPVNAADYQTLMGKVVAVVVKSARFAYYLGRVVSITEEVVTVSRDNAEWSARTESRKVIASIARVVSILETPVH